MVFQDNATAQSRKQRPRRAKFPSVVKKKKKMHSIICILHARSINVAGGSSASLFYSPTAIICACASHSFFLLFFFLLSLSLCSAEVNANGCAQLRDASISSRAARSDEGNLRMCGTPPQWCAVGRGAGGEPVRANGSARRSYPPASISRCRPPLAG